mmetsp:Transcript_36545/g.74579  ORF Transcript_36545/g.74579 Transcript_36545/m.74579 type:complete len:378 (+) Transcript_36545:87-1220(+)
MRRHLSATWFFWLLVIKNASSFSSRAKNFVPIIACKSTSEVCKAIDVYVNADDRVLELGAQLSDVSTHLCQAVGPAGNAVLVDVKRKDATSGRSKGRDTTPFLGTSPESENSSANFVDRVEYHELDQFDQWRELTKGKQSYQVLILDVGSMIGGDLYLSALSLAYEFIGNQEHLPRAIIVKSKVLNNLARRIVHSQRLLDGTIKLPKKDELDTFPNPIIVPCVGVNDYRKTIPILLEQGDEVIEIGSHYGSTTTILHDAVKAEEDGFCVGVDIGEKIITAARKRYPKVQFEVADAWDTLQLLKLKPPGSSLGYDAVYADIGGLSGAHGLLESLALIDAISRALEPRVITIKSLCMKRLATQLIPCSSVKRRSFQNAK